MIAPGRPELRDYQLDLVERLRAHFRAGRRRVVGVGPTGSGKAIIGAAIVESAAAKGSRVCLLAHRKELIDQLSQKLDLYGCAHGVIKAGHPRVDPSATVQIACVPTLIRRLARPPRGEPDLLGVGRSDRLAFDFLVFDECHHLAAGSWRSVMDAFPEAPVLGLTATPYRLDGKGLGDLFEVLEAGPQVPDLIAAGWLVRPRVLAPPPPQHLSTVKEIAGDISMSGAAAVLDATAPLTEIISTWQTRAAGRITVAFACTIRHAEHIAAAFRAAGVAAVAIDGSTDASARDRALAALARGEIQVLVNCMLLAEGWDLPSCSCVILARPTASRSLWRQMVGRGLRSAPGKTDCLILDHVGAVHRFGMPDEPEHYSLETPRPLPMQQLFLCLSCSAVVPDGSHTCPVCQVYVRMERTRRRGGGGGSHEGSPRELAVRQELHLSEPRVMTQDERQAIYHRLLEEARNSGYSIGWAAHRYRDRFGTHPPRPWLDSYEQLAQAQVQV